MGKIVPSAALFAGALIALASALPVASKAATWGDGPLAVGSAVEVSSQARSQTSPRPPTRLRVTPRRYNDNSPYPRTTPTDYPGPGAYRECVGGYVEERRPSGTVIVPRMSCWWVRG